MFASLFRAGEVEDRSPWGDFWFAPLGRRTAGGRGVTADSAMQLATVYACVKILAESMGTLPFRLYRPRVGGGRLQVTDHWLVKLFQRPNPYQNRVEWRQMVQGHLALRGNAYNRIVPDGMGGIAALMPIHPDRIRPELLTTGNWRYQVTGLDGGVERVPREEIWHLRGVSSDGVSGMSPIEVQREVLGAALGAQDYSARFWANDGKPTGGWLEYPGKFANDATRDKLKEQLQRATSSGNRHRTLVLDSGMKYHEVGLSNKDSQFLEARGFGRTEICSIWRMPPHKVGDLSRATFSNIEQQDLEFWGDTMLPWVDIWQAAAEALLGPDESDLQADFDMRSRMRGDAASRSAYLHAGVLDGWLTRNEARGMEGLDPLDGLDEPLVPINEREANEPAEDSAPVQTPAPDPDAAPDESAEEDAPAPRKDKSSERLHTLLAGQAARMARRIASGDLPPASVLADALAVPGARALAWLAEHPDATSWPLEAITASLLTMATS